MTSLTTGAFYSTNFRQAGQKMCQLMRIFSPTPKEDDGEAELAKSEMMVASSVLYDLSPHSFVICVRRDKGVDSVLYPVHASKYGKKRRDVAFFYSFNQSIRELRFHPFGFGNTVHNGSHDEKAIFTFGYTLWMPLTVPLGFAPVCYLYKSQLY